MPLPPAAALTGFPMLCARAESGMRLAAPGVVPALAWWEMVRERAERGFGVVRIGNHSRYCGAVAQLGERVNGIDEVRGSNPLSSTIVSGVSVERSMA